MEENNQVQPVETDEDKLKRIEARLAEIQANRESRQQVVQPTASVESTETPTEPVELTRMQKLFGVGNGLAGTKLLDYSDGGFIYGAGKGPLEYYSTDFKEAISAPGQGTIDTAIDTINMVSPGGIPDIKKAETYENKAAQAVRSISGLVIPSLALRGMAINAASKYHAGGHMANISPKIYNLGNRKSFQFISKWGIDVFTGGLVDYVAKQNQEDDNFLGTLKKYWPQTFQWISGKYATVPGDTPDIKRMKNVNEGAIFSMLSSIVEGFAYIAKADKSLKNTGKFIPSKEKGVARINEIAEAENAKYSHIEGANPIETAVLRNQAKQNDSLNEISQYYELNGKPSIDFNKFEQNETLVRSVDGSIFNSWVDATKILNNIDSEWGRLANPLSEAARMKGLELENLYDRTLISELTGQLKKGGKFGYRTGSNTYITEQMLDTAGNIISAKLLNPRAETNDIINYLKDFHRAVDESAVKISGKKGISKAIKELKAQLLDLDAHKARALLITSEAGQISDMSEGVRLMEDSAVVNSAIDKIIDRLELLNIEKGLANFEGNSMINNLNAWRTAVATGDKATIDAAAGIILDDRNSRLLEIIPKAKEYSRTLKTIAREQPKWLKSFLLASELADGDVDSLWKMHKYVQDKLGTFNKSFYDTNPEVPSIINKAFQGNLFNSILSAFATPINALVGNLTGLLGRGAATVVGSVVEGDLLRAKKAMVAHFALDDTLQLATDHMRVVFRKAATNPKEVSFMTRGDLLVQEEKSLAFLREFANTASEEGEHGAQALLRIYEDLDAMGVDPALRFSSNAMTAFDGFSKSVVANTEAKYLALNRALKEGRTLTKADLQKAKQEIYDGWFDDNGLLRNETVDKITSEIALNADSPVVQGMNDFIRRFPVARYFIWFPKTTANTIDVLGKWSPGGIFSGDYQKMWGPFGAKTLDDFSYDEMVSILQSKGRPIDDHVLENFQTLRYEIKGKAAISGSFMTMAFFAGINDRCTGQVGHYNQSIQNSRKTKGWKPKMCKNPVTGDYESYAWMGPVGDWLALAIDTVDNADSLDKAFLEDWMPKMLAVFGGALTDRSVLAQLEPLHDVLKGNGAQANRWAANFTNILMPLGSARNELSKLMYPQLRQLRTEFDDNLRKRNAYLDTVDPERALSYVVDPIDGKVINGDWSWFTRIRNTFTPFKTTDAPGPENQWLIDIEFNHNPSMNMSNGGARLENHEITAIHSIMGKQGIYKKELNRIKRRAENLTYTLDNGTVITGFRNIIRAARLGNIPSDALQHNEFGNVFNEIKHAYNKAKSLAEDALGDYSASDKEREMYVNIKEREAKVKGSKYFQRQGDIENAIKLVTPSY